MSELQQIAVDKIIAGNNDRKQFNKQELQELANSIAEHGLAQPPTLRPVGDGMYEIVAGERRTRAMRDVLGWTHIPAIVRELDDEKASAIMLIENIERKDLNPIEEAHAYAERMDRFGWGIGDLVRVSGKNARHIEKMLSLLQLAEDIQHYVKIGQFPVAYAIKIIELDKNRQRIAIRAFNSTPSMSQYKWSDIIGKLADDQASENQASLFSLEQVLADMSSEPIKGRKARTGVCADKTLPPVRVCADDSMALIFDRYIARLREAGQVEAAGAVGNIYNTFVARGWVNVRDGCMVDDMGAGLVEDELHED
jgi:ParB family chromosome partitioning protein